MSHFHGRFTAIVLLVLAAASVASTVQRTLTEIQPGQTGQVVRMVTGEVVNSDAATQMRRPTPSDPSIDAVGEMLWSTSDATGLMDNVAISDDGSVAAVGISLNNFRLQVLDVASGQVSYEVPGEDGLSSVAVTPDGSYVVWAQSQTLYVYPGDQPALVWSATLPDGFYHSAIGLSADGQRIAAPYSEGGDSLYLSVYPISSSVPLWSIALPVMTSGNHWIGARFSGDGTKILATSRFRLFVLDAATGNLLWDEDARNTEHPASISGDGHVLAAAGNNDGKLRCYLWDEVNDTYIQFWEYRFSGGTSNWGTATAVSYDGQTVAGGSMQFNGASYEGYVAVHETNGGGIPLWVSAGMGDLVGDIEISDDGLTIAACSWGYMNDAAPDIRVFQKYNATPFYQYTHPGSPNDMDMSADGSYLIAGGKAVHNRTFGNGGYAYAFSLDLEGGSVAGTVTLAGTMDYSGVTVEAEGTNLYVTTGANGTYQLDHIPAGTYTVTARRFGYTWGTASNIVVTEDGLTSNVNFNLSEAEAAPQNLVAVSGQVASIPLSWNALGAFARDRRLQDALFATGDILENPNSELRNIWAASGNPWYSTEERERRPRSLDDPDSIHIWRAPLSGGPYTLVGSVAGSATGYSDNSGIWPSYTYYYVVTAVYSNGESYYSNEAAAALDDSYLNYEPVVPEYTTPVTFDGVISANEWTDAVRIDISDVFGYDGVNPPQSAYLYMKYNDEDNLLYLACEDFLNSALDDGEGFGIYVDDDDSDTWSYNRSGSEGNYWAYYYSSGATLRYRSLSGAPYNADPYYTFTNPQIAFSVASGHFAGEVAIPMGFQELYQMALYGPDKTPGIGFFVIQRQAGNPIFDGWWPQNIPSIVSNPEYFSNSSVQASLHVPPAAPSNVEVTRVGTSLHVEWSDPSLGIDDLPVNGLAGLLIYRNGEVVDIAPPTVQSYTDPTVIYGGRYDYSISGFVTEEGVDYEGPQSAPVGAYAGEEPEIEYLVYDDGGLEYYMIVSGVYDQNRFAVRCDMPATHDFVYTIQLAVNAIAPIGVGVASDQGGTPGVQEFGPYFLNPPVAEEMFTVHITGEDFPAPGDVFWTTIDWTVDRPWEPGIATDATNSQGRSYWHQGASGWQSIVGNVMVRTGVGDLVSDAPEPAPGVVHNTELQANYPNPFNPETMIPFSLAHTGEATLAIYNITGQRVATLIQGRQPAGYHVARWNGKSDAGVILGSGVYFARLDAGEFTQARKLMMLK